MDEKTLIILAIERCKFIGGCAQDPFVSGMIHELRATLDAIFTAIRDKENS